MQPQLVTLEDLANELEDVEGLGNKSETRNPWLSCDINSAWLRFHVRP